MITRAWGWLIIFGLVYWGFLLGGASVEAAGTTFSQRILPLDCIFTTVNGGTGELYYVTPEACGVVLPPVELGASPGNGGLIYRYTAGGGTPVFNLNGRQNPNLNLAWQPLFTTRSERSASVSQNRSLADKVLPLAGAVLLVVSTISLIFIL